MKTNLEPTSSGGTSSPDPHTAAPSGARAVLVTGASGFIGRQLVRALAGQLRRSPGAGSASPSDEAGAPPLERLVAVDVREVPASERLPGVTYRTLDVCAPELADLVAEQRVDTIVHLAAIVTPPRGMSREAQRRVDLGGTENVLAAAEAHGVKKLIVTSSGAAYGYHADAPAWLTEDDPLRGNEAFAYSDHKRQVEELLARHRAEHPALGQLVLRVGTVLGREVKNQITALFEQPVVIGLREATTPFVFVWDEDLVACLVAGVLTDRTGDYNVAGDGVLTLREIAAHLDKPFVGLPADLMERALAALEKRGLVPYGPEQVCFLRYRPVLANTRLKEVLGFRPERTTREAFEAWAEARAARTPAPRSKLEGLAQTAARTALGTAARLAARL